MKEYLLLLLGTALVNNVILVRFLGLCPFLGVSGKLETALGMGLATTFVLTLTSGATWVVEHALLQPLDMMHLRILTYILVIAAVVQFTEMAIQKASPVLHHTLGIYLPLITTNCAVLGIAILAVQKDYNLLSSVIYAASIAAGFTLALILMAGIREQLELNGYPKGMKGFPLSLITAGLLSLAFMGFAGLVK